MDLGGLEYAQLVEKLNSYPNVPKDLIQSLWSYTIISDQQDRLQDRLKDRFNEPMPWIGLYIAFASLFCVLAMVADLLHGLRNKKLWFPCKYFTLNAASLSVVAVAMKLPMDLNNPMPGNVDQAAKHGSMAFMCTMMSHFLPALATLENKELVANIIALGVLVITLVVNVCIQIKTGVVSDTLANTVFGGSEYKLETISSYNNKSIAIVYVAMLLMLLIIHACSALAILNSKQILESKYQAAHEIASKNLDLKQTRRLTVHELREHVRNYWIMAGTGNPQFMTACSATTSASGIICALSTLLHVIIFLLIVDSLWDFDSDYKWSMLVILITQFMESVLGTIAPLSRCFAALSFKLSLKWIWNNMKVFKVESYWTQTLSDLKESSIPFVSSSRNIKFLVHDLKVLILIIFIGFQKAVVVICKMIRLTPMFIVICIFNCSCCWKWLKSMLNAFGIASVKNPELQESNENFSQYVLQIQDDMELAERTLKWISNSFDRLIKKAEKKQPYNLMKLLEGSTGGGGLEKFDIHHGPPLLLDEPLNCWSLPLVTLTTIAIFLPNIQNKILDRLMRGVSEGLMFVTLMEESLKATATDDHVRIQKAAKTLWLEVEGYHKWLGKALQTPAQVYTGGQTLQWFWDTAMMVTEVESTDIRGRNDNSKCRSICANSMYRITERIILSYHQNINEVSQEELFVQLSSVISDILTACLANLPQVIVLKCHSSAIEKRETSVYAAAQLLGETTQIINTLQDRELASLNPDELAFVVDKWRAYIKHPYP